jgi:hypothetical protein
MQYPVVKQALDTIGSLVRVTGQEQVVCVTRWNSLWKADTLRAIELFTVVFVPTVIQTDTQVVPEPSVGNCWWRFPSVHWHVYNDEPSEDDYIFAAHSTAPFHLIATGTKETLRLRLYAVRPLTLKRDNPR